MGQNVGTPRIYVDWGSWLKSIGQFELLQHGGISNRPDLLYPRIGLNVSVQQFPTTDADSWHTINMTSGAFGDLNNFPNYCAVLGHNFATVGNRFSIESFNGSEATGMGEVEIINVGSNGHSVNYDGFSIMEFSNPTHHEYIRPFFAGWDGTNMIPHTQDLKIGSICYGRYYDFSHSPDLNLTMTIENDGITTQQTKGGATLTNARYSGAPKWGDLGAWELQSYSAEGNPTSWSRNSQLGARTGRRSWNLTFSYLSDKQTLPVNALGGSLGDSDSLNDSNGYTEGEDWYSGGAAGDIFGTQGNILSVLNGEDFFSSVWSKTMGGHLPFIFQQDRNNSNPDQFAICRFDMDSLQVKQVAFNTYTISLKIRECW